MYILGATCYWLLVEATPIFFMFIVHYRNFTVKLDLDRPESSPIRYYEEIRQSENYLDVDDNQSSINSSY